MRVDEFENLKQREIIILTTSQSGCIDQDHIVTSDYLDTASHAIIELGYYCRILKVDSSADLKKKLPGLNPCHTVILNLVEQIDDLPYGYHIAPRLLETIGFTYTGNNANTLIDSCDKIKIKELLVGSGVSTPRYTVLYPNAITTWSLFPCIVKPAFEHCSYGISPYSVVDNKNELLIQARTLFDRFKQPLIVEEFITGPEYFVPVWGYEIPQILPPIVQTYSYAADYHQQIYDYDSKWDKKAPSFKKYALSRSVTSDAPPSVKTEVLNAIKSCGCHGYSRIDVRLQNNTPYVIDINPIPISVKKVILFYRHLIWVIAMAKRFLNSASLPF